MTTQKTKDTRKHLDPVRLGTPNTEGYREEHNHLLADKGGVL